MNKTYYYSWDGSSIVGFYTYTHKLTLSESLNIPTKIFSRTSPADIDIKTYNILIKL